MDISTTLTGPQTMDTALKLETDENSQVVLQPYHYLTSLPSKGFRDQAIDSLNQWLKVPPKSGKMIKNVIKMLHSASLMSVYLCSTNLLIIFPSSIVPVSHSKPTDVMPRLDDLEDGSPLRRGKPSTHDVFGNAQTINSATYQYTEATAMAAELSNPACLRVFTEEMQQLYIGQSYDLYWTHNAICPSIAEYLKMVDKKTGGLFNMLTRLMLAESPRRAKVAAADDDLKLFSLLLGRFFQIRDDYQNLSSADYAQQKGFAEDLDEGKYSFTLIHCVQTLESEPRFAGAMMQLRAFLMKRRAEGKLGHEVKREVLATMRKTKSLEYTLGVLRELHAELEKEVRRLEGRFQEENFSLRLMLDLLKV